MAPRVVSIGVPTYNRVRRLEKSIRFMLEQDYRDVEIVVSDNASTDETPAFCQELARKDPRVLYHRQPRNVGPIQNYGEVLKLATGEFYMHLADDDELDLSYVSRCMAALDADPDLLVACGRSLMYVDGAFSRESVRTNLLDTSPAERVITYYATVEDNGGFHGVTRRSALASLPPMRDHLMGGDWLWFASVAFKGRVKTVENTHIIKHMGGTSASMFSIARTLGLSPMYGRYALESILYNVFRDIAWQAPIYDSLGTTGRLALAYRVATVLGRRWRSRWTGVFLRGALTDAVLPADVKQKLVSLRDQWVGR